MGLSPKKQKRCPLRKRKVQVDINNCSFTSHEDDDVPEVTSAHDDYNMAQAHKNFIEELSNATFVYDDGQQVDAHGSVNSSLDMSLEMEEVGGNVVDFEFENNPDEEEGRSPIPNAKKPRGKNKSYVLVETFENKIEFERLYCSGLEFERRFQPFL